MKLSVLTKSSRVELKQDIYLYLTNFTGIYLLIQSAIYGSIILLFSLGISISDNKIVRTVQFSLALLIVATFLGGIVLNLLKIFRKKLNLYARVIAYYMFPIAAGLTSCIWTIGKV